MKVIILGGCGGMGRYAADLAATFDNIDLLTISDLYEKDAKEFAASLGSHVDGLGVDVNDIERLNNILPEYDVVLNTVGPFFKFGYQILKSALKSNCHYMDICDDWEPTEEMLKLDGIAKEKNLLAIIGLGASPGITNLLGSIAIDQLDDTKIIYTGWNMGEAKPEKISSQTKINAAIIHGIEQISGRVKIFKDNIFKMVRPLKEIQITYPNRGNFKTRVFGHPEAITFPHHYKRIHTSINLVHGDKTSIFILRLINKLIALRILSKRTAARFLEWMESIDRNRNISTSIVLPEIYALAVGTKQNKSESVGVSIETTETRDLTMGESTGYTLALGLKMFLKNEISSTGVIGPESKSIDARKFLSELFLIFGYENATIKLDKSWEN